MIDILLNPITSKWLDAFVKRPSSTLLIKTDKDQDAGDYIIHHLYSNLVESKIPIISISPVKDSIGIDQIRQLQQSLSLSADKGLGKITRMAVIFRAHTLTVEAQNALLKLMEELPKRSVLCLVAGDTSNLLETILSRCFLLNILPVDKKQAINFATKYNYDSKDIDRSYLLTEGKSGLFMRLLEDGITELELSVSQAKKFITSSIHDRQKIIKELSVDSDNLPKFIHSLDLISKMAMSSAKEYESKQRWKNIYKATLASNKQLAANVSPKLVLLNLSLEI